ncbi:Penicillin-binding protein 1A [Granulosicoccus antarcticus IMCC3135]|uniref:Penicillin-binding protein 1A n=2 Tax=Granulosicoccus TaxID=437504 RepID=A0A2Z2NIH5_9GAMM|nr:Penicillin-binding protein 1A [Granulosicoccus antarcticus IMCC3135]
MGIGYLYYTIAPTLPDVQQLREVQLQMPLRIFTAEGDLIAEYGEKRREPVMISEVPDSLKNSIIAAEDQTFYTHPGVAWQGLARAAFYLVKTGRKGPGGSTITMQVARNFFLSNERTYDRKIREIFLSFKIESELAKDEILELYINKIYLGTRSYGFAAASRVYYGKSITELDLAESAMLAGLPKAPSRYNPIVNPERALLRRDYVLGRLLALGMIDQQSHDSAKAEVVTAELHTAKPDVEADYVGEMVRARVEQLFGKNWANAGYKVYTSIRSQQQTSANTALRDALYDYERRHGYTGPLAQLDAETMADPLLLSEALEALPNPGDLLPAAVISVQDDNTATVMTETGEQHVLPFEDVEWARERISIDKQGDEITNVNEVMAVGDVIALQRRKDGSARFVQEPAIEGAFIAMEPDTGEITALVGGYDYYRSKFNRATQARRQPGSTFKPFIYSAALNAGDTAATIYNDAPVVFHDSALEGEWRPSNYSGRFFGPTRLREALVKSRNLVSVRVLREIGIPYAVEYAQRFGFEPGRLPPDLSLALGNASVTPMEMSGAFAVFANGGYKVPAHFIDRVEDPRGNVIYSTPKVVFCDDCDPNFVNPLDAELESEGSASNGEPATGAAVTNDEVLEVLNNEDATAEESAAASLELKKVLLDTVDAPRVIDERNAYLMTSMMREVVQRGTARRAGEALKRGDLAGKTGTTNNQLDAWFVGFNPKVVAAAWIGSDGLDPLGRGEAGGVAALPMWTSFIAETLAGTPEVDFPPPPGLKTIRIDRKTGEPAAGDNTMLELFLEDNMPDAEALKRAEAAEQSSEGDPVVDYDKSRSEKVEEVEQLF